MESRKPSNPKKKRKKKGKAELDQKPEIIQNIVSGAITPVVTDNKVVTEEVSVSLLQSPPSTIPEVTITPPEEDPSLIQELYTPPETNILNQSANKKKKKKKKPQRVIVVKDEVRPSPVLKYEPPSRRRSIVLQPTVNELEETCEDEIDCSSTCIPPSECVSEVKQVIVHPQVNCEVPSSATSIKDHPKCIFKSSLESYCTASNSTLPTCDLGSAKSVDKNIIIEEELVNGENGSPLILENSDTAECLLEPTQPKDITPVVEMPVNEKSKMKDIPVKKELGEVKLEGQTKTKAQLKAERKAAFEAQQGAQISSKKSDAPQKSKAELKAERRAVQESQRALKETPKVEDSLKTGVTAPELKTQNLPTTLASTKMVSTKTTVANKTIIIADPPFKKQATKVSQEKELAPRKMCLFSHLPKFIWDTNLTADLGLSGRSIHPAVIRAGLRMAQGLIAGSDARCVATLAAFIEVIKDYVTPPQKELSRDLDAKLKTQIKFLNKCRPLSVSMNNAIKKLRWNITQIPSSMKDDDAKRELVAHIDTFIREEIIISKKTIAEIAAKKIRDRDVILIYACSPLVKQVLAHAHSENKDKHFKVIVVDSRPGLDGREMLKYLVSKKIECSYVLINAVSYVMKEVNLVLLDCHSLQANGFVMSRVGSSQIALVAQACNVPVLVCCETYKFCEQVHTDSFVDNELGNPQDLVTSTPAEKCHLENWKDIPCLNLVNMTYDVTPPDLVTSVITEIGMLPCTSVPVVLRVKHLAMPDPSK